MSLIKFILFNGVNDNNVRIKVMLPIFRIDKKNGLRLLFSIQKISFLLEQQTLKLCPLF